MNAGEIAGTLADFAAEYETDPDDLKVMVLVAGQWLSVTGVCLDESGVVLIEASDEEAATVAAQEGEG